jgi:hypothetical protein
MRVEKSNRYVLEKNQPWYRVDSAKAQGKSRTSETTPEISGLAGLNDGMF